MYQQVGLTYLVESRLERVHEVCRQLADESYGVSQQERQVVDDHLTNGGVECGKQLVLGKDVALGQQVHQGRLAHVGIAYQGDTNQTATVFALGGLLAVYLL